jgi:hypothetical protein
MTNSTKRVYTEAQLNAIRGKAARKAAEAKKAETPAVETAPKARAPQPTFDLKVNVLSVVEKIGPAAGPFAYARISYTDKAGKLHEDRAAMAFGEAYEAVKASLVAGAEVALHGCFRTKKGVGSSFNITGLALAA